MAKAILGKKKKIAKVEVSHSLISNLYYKAMIIKNSLVLAENQINRWMGQNWEPRNTPMCVLTIKAYNKGVKNIQWRMDNLFNKWCWKNWADTCKKKKKKKKWTRSLSNTMQKVDSRWIKDLNVKHETLHLLGKKKNHRQYAFWYWS